MALRTYYNTYAFTSFGGHNLLELTSAIIELLLVNKNVRVYIKEKEISLWLGKSSIRDLNIMNFTVVRPGFIGRIFSELQEKIYKNLG